MIRRFVPVTIIDYLALILVCVIVVEFFVWSFFPDVLLEVADFIYDRPILNQVLHAGGALIVLLLIVPSVSVEEIMAVSMFVGLLAGLIVTPFGSDMVDLIRQTIRQERIWPQLVSSWLIILLLAGWTVMSVFELF